MDARRTPPRYTVPPSPSNLLLGFMSRRFSRVDVFGVGIVDPAWRQMQGDQCRVPRVGCRYPMGYPLSLLGAPWLVAGMPQPAGNTVGLAGQEPRPLQEGCRRQAGIPHTSHCPRSGRVPPGQPSVSQLRHPSPTLGHDRLSRDTSHADQHRHLQYAKAALGEGTRERGRACTRLSGLFC